MLAGDVLIVPQKAFDAAGGPGGVQEPGPRGLVNHQFFGSWKQDATTKLSGQCAWPKECILPAVPAGGSNDTAPSMKCTDLP